MNKFFIAILMASMVAGCSKSGGDKPEGPIAGSQNGSGTIVGNGGDETPLRFTLFALKGFEYWKQKTEQPLTKYVRCAQELKASENPKKPWTDKEWQDLLLAKCGDEPQPKTSYFDAIDRALKITKLFLSDDLNCQAQKNCNEIWKSFGDDNKIYISPTRWNSLSESAKLHEALLAYDTLVSDSHSDLIDRELETEIFKQVFEVDYSMDILVNFLDVRKIKIADDASEVFTEAKVISQMSLAMDCIRLVEKRFPNQINLKTISLIDKDPYKAGYPSIYPEKRRELFYGENADYARAEFGIAVFATDPQNLLSKKGVKSLPTSFFIGRYSNLQSCYNALVSQGLKNPIVDDIEVAARPKLELKPPMAGESELTLDFINIAFKALNYIIQDQRQALSQYQQCSENNPVATDLCQLPLLKNEEVDELGKVFATLIIQETEKKLCTKEIPNCSESDSLTLINDPANHNITFNQSKWKNLSAQSKIKLALHEIFGIVGIETNDYHVSSYFTPLIYTEQFNVDFTADELRAFLIDRLIIADKVGDYYDQIHFQDRATLLMDCLKLVEQRFPNRLNIGLVSLRNESSVKGVNIQKNGIGRRVLIPGPLFLDPKYSRILKVGTDALSLDADTTLQQCYNKVVAVGLKDKN